MNRRVFVTVSLAALALGTGGLLTSCGPSGDAVGTNSAEVENGADAKPWRVGVIQPLTGSLAAYGSRARNGTSLAAEEINARGGVGGRKIELVIVDSKGNGKGGVAAMRRLLTGKPLDFVVGDLASKVTLAVAPIVEESQVVYMATGSSAPAVAQAGDYIFRNFPCDSFSSKVMAGFLCQEQGLSKLAVVAPNDELGKSFADEFTAEVNRLGGTMVAREEYESDDLQAKEIATKIANRSPQAVYVPGYPKQSGLMYKALREASYTGMLATDVVGEAPEFRSILGGAVDGTFFAAPAFDPTADDERIQHFVAAYKSAYEQEPDNVAACAYDAVQIFAKAASELKPFSQDNVKSFLYGLKGYPGVSGSITFDANGDVEKDFLVKRYQGSKPVLVKRF